MLSADLANVDARARRPKSFALFRNLTAQRGTKRQQTGDPAAAPSETAALGSPDRIAFGAQLFDFRKVKGKKSERAFVGGRLAKNVVLHAVVSEVVFGVVLTVSE